MQHKHLLPHEIDLLLDNETGFGVQTLRTHVRECARCRARLNEAASVAASLVELPTLAPRIGMADRVMSQVPVFVPWYVAAGDALVQLVPRDPSLRAVAISLVALVGSLVTGATLWLATQSDVLAVVTGIAGDRARDAGVDLLGEATATLVGPQTLLALQQVGPVGFAVVGAGFVVTSVLAVLSLRHIAISSRGRRV